MHGYITKRKQRYHNLVDIFSHKLFSKESIDTSPGLSPFYQLIHVPANESVLIDSLRRLAINGQIDGH